jgi:hypothetical protein
MFAPPMQQPRRFGSAVSLASSGVCGQNLIQFGKLYCSAAVGLRRTYWIYYEKF